MPDNPRDNIDERPPIWNTPDQGGFDRDEFEPTEAQQTESRIRRFGQKAVAGISRFSGDARSLMGRLPEKVGGGAQAVKDEFENIKRSGSEILDDLAEFTARREKEKVEGPKIEVRPSNIVEVLGTAHLKEIMTDLPDLSEDERKRVFEDLFDNLNAEQIVALNKMLEGKSVSAGNFSEFWKSGPASRVNTAVMYYELGSMQEIIKAQASKKKEKDEKKEKEVNKKKTLREKVSGKWDKFKGAVGSIPESIKGFPGKVKNGTAWGGIASASVLSASLLLGEASTAGMLSFGAYAVGDHLAKTKKLRVRGQDKKYSAVEKKAKKTYVEKQEKHGELALATYISHELEGGSNDEYARREARQSDVLKRIGNKLEKDGRTEEANNHFMRSALASLDIRDSEEGGRSVVSEKYARLIPVSRAMRELKNQFFDKPLTELAVNEKNVVRRTIGASLNFAHKAIIGYTIGNPALRTEVTKIGLPFGERFLQRFAAVGVPAWLQEMVERKGKKTKKIRDKERKNFEKAVDESHLAKLKKIEDVGYITAENLAEINRKQIELDQYLQLEKGDFAGERPDLRAKAQVLSREYKRVFDAQNGDIDSKKGENETNIEKRRRVLLDKAIAEVDKKQSFKNPRSEYQTPKRRLKAKKKEDYDLDYLWRVPEKMWDFSAARVSEMYVGAKKGAVAAIFGKVLDNMRIGFDDMYKEWQQTINDLEIEEPAKRVPRQYPSNKEEPFVYSPQEGNTGGSDLTKEQIREISGLKNRRVPNVGSDVYSSSASSRGGDSETLPEKKPINVEADSDGSKNKPDVAEKQVDVVPDADVPKTWEEELAERTTPAERLSSAQEYIKFAKEQGTYDDLFGHSSEEQRQVERIGKILAWEDEFFGVQGQKLKLLLDADRYISMDSDVAKDKFEELVEQHYASADAYESGILRKQKFSLFSKNMRANMISSEVIPGQNVDNELGSTPNHKKEYFAWLKKHTRDAFSEIRRAAMKKDFEAHQK
jgi:hypothetical protein